MSHEQTPISLSPDQLQERINEIEKHFTGWRAFSDSARNAALTVGGVLIPASVAIFLRHSFDPLYIPHGTAIIFGFKTLYDIFITEAFADAELARLQTLQEAQNRVDLHT